MGPMGQMGRMGRMKAALVGAIAIGGVVLAGEAKPAEMHAPWGKTVDGLACRIAVPREVCIGEAVPLTVEIKNVSEETRYVVSVFDILFPKHARLSLSGPDARPLQPSQRAETTLGPRSLQPIAPGEVKRIEFPDLAEYFWAYDPKSRSMRSLLETPGPYDLSYTFIGTRLPQRMAVGEGVTDGKRERIYETLPEEKVAKTWAGTLVSNPATFTVRELRDEDLRVHEWGVFSVYSEAKYANAGQKAEWASLPDFFYRQFPAVRLRWAPAAWNKPLLYFYTTRPSLKVQVKLTFAEGAPVVWWPCCERPVDESVGRGPAPPKPAEAFRTLEWSVWLGGKAPVGSASFSSQRGWKEVSETPLPAGSWLLDARLKEASLLSTTGTPVARRAPWNVTTETERFIYYDGLVPAPDFLRCVEATAEAVTLKNAAAFPIRGLFVVDRRAVEKAGAIRFAHEAGPLGPQEARRIALSPVPARDWPGEARKEVHAALVAAGLFEAEAAAALRIWDKGFFGAPGVTAFYILPQAEYDRMLPLTLRPSPRRVVRVGIALHPGFAAEPELAQRAERLIGQLDKEPPAREAAAKELAQMGPVAWRAIREALGKAPSAETAKLMREILDNTDATKWLP